MKDGTVAIQAALAQAQLQWPFLHDISLVSAITSVFLPAAAAAPGGDDFAAAAAAGAVARALQPGPWLYFNLLLVNSALFTPVLDKARLFLCWFCSLMDSCRTGILSRNTSLCATPTLKIRCGVHSRLTLAMLRFIWCG